MADGIIDVLKKRKAALEDAMSALDSPQEKAAKAQAAQAAEKKKKDAAAKPRWYMMGLDK